MFKTIKRNWMAFTDIFKNENDFNEKTIVGFLSFAMMTIFAFADIFTGLFGKDLVIQDFIYNSFVIITLGSFGIAEAGNIFSKKDTKEEEI